MTDASATDHPVILFDGVCNLCEGFVQWVIRRDPDATFRFAPLQSPVGEELLADCGLAGERLESVVLVEEQRCYRKSDAVIRVLARLGYPYRLVSPGRFVPRVLRDVAYDFVADRRYGWFGQKDACMMPTPDIRDRFLAGAPGGPSGTQGGISSTEEADND